MKTKSESEEKPSPGPAAQGELAPSASTPKFKVGQVVMLTMRREQPFKILAVRKDCGGYFYAWNRNNYASEHLVRELTKEEKGE